MNSTRIVLTFLLWDNAALFYNGRMMAKAITAYVSVLAEYKNYLFSIKNVSSSPRIEYFDSSHSKKS